MSQSVVLLLVAILNLSCSRDAVRARASDTVCVGCLFREPAEFYNAKEELYRAVVAQAFADEMGFVGSCLQMVTLTDGAPEEIVSAACSSGESDGQLVPVVHLVANESIAGKFSTGGVESAKTVSVRRSEGQISARDSELLRDLWEAATERSVVETGTRLREVRSDQYFAVMRKGTFKGRIGAVAKNPATGSVGADLIQVGNLLTGIAECGKECEVQRDRLRSFATNLLSRIRER